MSSNGVDDMFEPAPWNLDETVKQCTRKYGVITRPYWINMQFGGKHIQATNIIFRYFLYIHFITIFVLYICRYNILIRIILTK